MKVCVDLTVLEMHDRFGGIGRMAVHLLRHLDDLTRERPVPFEICAAIGSDSPTVDIKTALDYAANLPAELVPSATHRKFRKERLGAHLRAAGVDVFHSALASANPRDPAIRLIVTVYDLVTIVCPNRSKTFFRFDVLRDRWRLRRNLAPASRVIAISARTRQDLVDECGIDASKIAVVPLGVDRSAFAETGDPLHDRRVREKLGLPNSYFVSVGSDHYRKNQTTLMRAWLDASSDVSEGLVFVGKGLYRDGFVELAEEARRRGHADRLLCLDGVSDEDLSSVYRGATSAIAPSLYEGFGMTLLEAASCGTPVLASRNGVHEEVGGSSIEYFEPRDATRLASLLREFARDAQRRGSQREKGLILAESMSWRSMAERTLALYEDEVTRTRR